MGCRFIPSDSCLFASPTPSKGWSLHHSPGETRILRGNTFVDGTVLVVYSGRDDMLRKEKAWGDAGALYADHSRQPS